MATYQPGELTVDQARELLRANAMTELSNAGEEEMAKYDQEAQSKVDDIVNRSANSKTDIGRLQFGNEAETPAPIADGEQVEPKPSLNSPGSPSIPKTGGMGDFDNSVKPSSADFSTPDSSGLNTTGPGDGLGDYSTDSNSGLDDSNPWESSVPDPDDVSGGLASGGGLGGGGLGGGGLGGGGLPGGGGPGGGGLGGGAGGGLGGGMGAGGAMGGMMGGAGGGRGMGAGAGGRGAGAKGMGKGMGAGGRGMAGGMMGGAGGGRGMGGQGEGEQETGTWLTEDDDVWGIGNEESDPYA
jgi:hypothetical protein